MLDRENVLAVLRKRFPDASAEQVAAAANALVALPDEWEEVPVQKPPQAVEVRIFKKRDQEA